MATHKRGILCDMERTFFWVIKLSSPQRLSRRGRWKMGVRAAHGGRWSTRSLRASVVPSPQPLNCQPTVKGSTKEASVEESGHRD